MISRASLGNKQLAVSKNKTCGNFNRLHPVNARLICK
jgi:hypothetical protein